MACIGQVPAMGGIGRGRAFTLVEILIVVAILAILSAIAVPNLLEAQTRAKVSRAKSDLRTVATALESYAVDHNSYPISADEQGLPISPYPPVGLGPEVFETRLSPAITTPVAYLASLSADPFAARGPDEEDPRICEGTGYHYGFAAYAQDNDGPEGATKFANYSLMLGFPSDPAVYFISSHGPDLDHDDDEDVDDARAAVPYDPTNGSVSSGDIVRFGPGANTRH